MFDLRAIFKLYGSSSDEGYRITLRNLDCLRTEFMPW